MIKIFDKAGKSKYAFWLTYQLFLLQHASPYLERATVQEVVETLKEHGNGTDRGNIVENQVVKIAKESPTTTAEAQNRHLRNSLRGEAAQYAVGMKKSVVVPAASEETEEDAGAVMKKNRKRRKKRVERFKQIFEMIKMFNLALSCTSVEAGLEKQYTFIEEERARDQQEEKKVSSSASEQGRYGGTVSDEKMEEIFQTILSRSRRSQDDRERQSVKKVREVSKPPIDDAGKRSMKFRTIPYSFTNLEKRVCEKERKDVHLRLRAKAHLEQIRQKEEFEKLSPEEKKRRLPPTKEVIIDLSTNESKQAQAQLTAEEKKLEAMRLLFQQRVEEEKKRIREQAELVEQLEYA